MYTWHLQKIGFTNFASVYAPLAEAATTLASTAAALGKKVNLQLAAA
jgi:hypothetical protein